MFQYPCHQASLFKKGFDKIQHVAMEMPEFSWKMFGFLYLWIYFSSAFMFLYTALVEVYDKEEHDLGIESSVREDWVVLFSPPNPY